MLWIQLDDINKRYSLTEGYIAGPAIDVDEAQNVASKIVEGKR